MHTFRDLKGCTGVHAPPNFLSWSYGADARPLRPCQLEGRVVMVTSAHLKGVHRSVFTHMQQGQLLPLLEYVVCKQAALIRCPQIVRKFRITIKKRK